jgi:hypothetical protein
MGAGRKAPESARGKQVSDRSFKVTVHFDRRADGGLRVWSDDVPGLVLSSADVDGAIEDVPVAIRVILSHMLCADVDVRPLTNIREALEANGIIARQPQLGAREYVAYCH